MLPFVLYSCAEETVKVKWKGLRDTYRRELKKQRSSVNVQNSSENARDPSWTHYSSMNFLREYMGSNNNQNDLFHFQGWPTDDIVVDEETSPVAPDEAFSPFVPGAALPEAAVDSKPVPATTSPTTDSTSVEDSTRDLKTEVREPPDHETDDRKSPPPSNPEDAAPPTVRPKKSGPSSRLSRLKEQRLLRSRLSKGKQTTKSHNAVYQNGTSPSSSRSTDGDSDDDLYFFKSLVPYVKSLPPMRKLYLRSEIHNLVLREIMSTDTTNGSYHSVIPLEHVTVGFNA